MKNLRLPPSQRHKPDNVYDVAVHEAAHAVACVKFGLPMKYVTIRQRRYETGVSQGHVYTEIRWGELLGKGESAVTPWLIQALAGVATESVASSGPVDMLKSGEKDVDSAAVLAACALYDGPMPESDALTFPVNPALVRPVLERATDLALDFVRENWKAIDRVARKLAFRKELTSDEVRAIVEETNS
jgi:hypothetical protein